MPMDRNESQGTLLADSYVVPSYIRLVVFDLDGTLVTHNYAYWCREAVRLYPQLGSERVSWARVRRDFGSDNFFAALPSTDRESLIRRFWDLYNDRNSPHPRCLPRIRSVLAQIKASGLKVAVATSRMESASSLALKLKCWKIDMHVDFLVTCVDAEEEPCPSKVPLLLRVLQLSSVSAREALMVGDSPTDIECAHSAGYAIQIAVCSGGIYPEVLAAARPTSVLSAVSSLCFSRQFSLK